MRMSDSKVPVSTVLDGIAAAQRAGFAPIKVNMVVKRGVNDHEIVPMAAHFRAEHPGVTSCCASSNTWTSATPTAGAWTKWSPRRRYWNDRRSLPDPPGRSQLHRRSRGALELCGWRRRDRRDRIDHPRVLPGLHPRPAVDRRQALHLSVRHRRPGPARPVARGRERRSIDRADRGALAAAQRPLFATALGRDTIHRSRHEKNRDVVYRR